MKNIRVTNTHLKLTRVNRTHPTLTFDSLREVKAYYFCMAAHGAIDQRRKYTDLPYSDHPLQVWNLVLSADGNEHQCAAALLHDVLEDTKINLELIARLFGPKTANIVNELCKVSKPEDGNRAVRHAIDVAFLSTISPESQTVKLADIISNSFGIMDGEREFIAIYLKEKLAEVNVLTKGSPLLREMALEVINKGLSYVQDSTDIPKTITTADSFYNWLHQNI